MYRIKRLYPQYIIALLICIFCMRFSGVLGISNQWSISSIKAWIIEYGFKEIEREVREVCDYANILEKEYLNKGIGIGVEKGIEQGTQNERIKNIRKLMIKLKMSFKEAIQFLDIPEDEVKEIEKYFKL
mgnify:CR=1 FL=1